MRYKGKSKRVMGSVGANLYVTYDKEFDILWVYMNGHPSTFGLGEDEYVAQWFGQEGGGEDNDELQGCMIYGWCRGGIERQKKIIEYVSKKTGWSGKELRALVEDVSFSL